MSNSSDRKAEMEEFNLDLEDNEDEHTPVYDSDEYWSVEMRRELAEAGLL